MEFENLLKQHSDAVEKQFDALRPDIKKALEEVGFLKAVTTELEQKMARRGTIDGSLLGSGSGQSWGQQFIASEGLKAFAENTSRPSRFRLELETKTITSAGGSLGQPYLDKPVVMPRRRLTVRDLIPVIPIASGSAEFPRQTTRTNAAAPVAEAALKPESTYAFTMETAVAQVIAHFVVATRQIMDDAPQLAGVIDGELRYGLRLVEEAQLLNGTGVSPNLDGLVPNATAYSAPFTPTGTPTMIDQLGLALLQVALADHEPSGIVLHPSDWVRARLLKNADGEYLLGEPGATVEPRLFGLPVVATQAMTIDKFLVGAFPSAAVIFDRQSATVELSTEDSDNFRKNLVTIRAEERLAQGIKDGTALVTGDLGGVALAAKAK